MKEIKGERKRVRERERKKRERVRQREREKEREICHVDKNVQNVIQCSSLRRNKRFLGFVLIVVLGPHCETNPKLKC